jgi:membrane protease subunit HflK
MIAHYRVRDAAEWSFYGPKAEDILRVEVSAAMVRSLGEMGVDRVLTDGREQLVANVAQRTQAGLDAAHSGLEISSLEVVDLAPPMALASYFDAVQSAYIAAQTQQSEAQAFAASAIPEAQSTVDQQEQSARADADAAMATAQGDAQAFHALEAQYRANSEVVGERLYRDAVERAISNAGTVRWIPPPVGGNYHGFRITLGAAPPQSSGVIAGSADDQ